jgi:hypothetical protein
MCSSPLACKHDAAVYLTAIALLTARGAGARCISDWSRDANASATPRPGSPESSGRITQATRRPHRRDLRKDRSGNFTGGDGCGGIHSLAGVCFLPK